jgi:hypothetical protein
MIKMKKSIVLIIAIFMVITTLSFSVNANFQKQQVDASFGWLEGTVKDGDDNPIDGALVRIFGGFIDIEDLRFVIVYEKQLTDNNGYYKFEIPEGKYTMLVTKEKHLPGLRYVVVSSEETEVANFNLIRIVNNIPNLKVPQQQSPLLCILQNIHINHPILIPIIQRLIPRLVL